MSSKIHRTKDTSDDAFSRLDLFKRQTAVARRAYRFDVPDDEGFDPYIVLGIHRNAGKEDIRAAYLALAKELHPDRRANDLEAEKRFKALNYAYHGLLLAKRQESSTAGRNGRLRLFVVLCAFLAPFACIGIHVLVFPPNGTSFAERQLIIKANKRARLDESKQTTQPGDTITTGSVEPTEDVVLAAVDSPEKTDLNTEQPDPNTPIFDGHAFLPLKDGPDLTSLDEGRLFLSTLSEQQDMLIVHNYLKFDAVGRDAPHVRAHLRDLILKTHDRSELAALLNVVGQDDHVEAALALGRIKKLNEEEINTYESIRWVAAVRRKTKPAYEAYLRRYPQGRYASLARKGVAALSPPQTKPVNDAATLLIAKENETWKKTREKNTKAAYETYKNVYPKGRYVNQANRKLALLKPVAVTLPVVVPAPVVVPPPIKVRETEQKPKKAPLWPTPDEPLVDQRFR